MANNHPDEISLKTLPKISIVVPTFNQGQFLEATLKSIVAQDYPNTEIIVIDGGSTDNTLEVIHCYEKHLKYWVSEPDRGQSHAINKGLEQATGDYFDWMNSDDLIAPDTFWKVAKAFEAQPNAYVVCGFMTYFEGEKFGKPVRMKIHKKLEDTLIFGSMSGPSMYFRLDKLRELGPLDEDLHHCFDLELWYRFVERYGVERLSFLNENLSFFRLHKDSKTVGQFEWFAEDGYLMHCSILNSCNGTGLDVIPAELLGITRSFYRSWEFQKFDYQRFAGLAMQRHLETLHQRLSFSIILKWYLKSWQLAYSRRSLRFIFLPARAIRWKLIKAIK